VKKGFKKPQTFAYPFGARNREIDNALLKYFVSLRGVTYTGSDGCISNLDRAFFSGSSRKVFFGVGIDRIYGNSVETIIEGLRRAKKENEVLILYGHKISKDPGEYVINPQKLKKMLDFVYSTEKLCFYTISDLGDFDSTRYNLEINKCQQN